MQARFAGEHIRPTSGPVPGALATSLTLGRRDDAQEREADAVAARAGAGPATVAPAGPGAGHDFANVRIHTDSRAVASAEAIGADAYTVGQHIVFAPGRYRPESAEGRGLLAHELAHTVQQAGRPEPVVRGKWRMESLKVDSGLEAQREEENAEVSTYGVPGSVYGRARAWQEQGIIRTEVGGVAQVARWTTLHYVFKNDGTDRDFLRLETKGQVTGNAKAEDLDHARASGVVWGGITERTHANPTPPAHKLFEPLEEGSISAATVTDLGTVEVDLPIGEGGSVHGSFKLHRVVQGAAAPFTQSTQPAYDVSPDVDEVDVVVGARMEADASIESSHAIMAWLDENRSDAFASVMLPRGGQIVDEYFDVDKSRSIPPARRPRASALLAALADPTRGFEAVVVGEPQRAFYGNQFGNLPDLRPLRRTALGARSRRPHRPRQRGPRPDHVRVRRRLQRRTQPDQDPRPHRHGRTSPARRPLPRRSAALRVPADRRGPAPQPGQGR
jgi:hypothetical protein